VSRDLRRDFSVRGRDDRGDSSEPQRESSDIGNPRLTAVPKTVKATESDSQGNRLSFPAILIPPQHRNC